MATPEGFFCWRIIYTVRPRQRACVMLLDRLAVGRRSPPSLLIRFVLALLFIGLISGEVIAGQRQEYKFDIPRQAVETALEELATQAELLLLFPYDHVLSVDANPVMGVYSVKDALDILLRGTGLSGDLTEGGVITISLVGSIENHSKGKEMKTKRTMLATMMGFLFGTTSVGNVGAADNLDDSLKATGGIEEIIVTAQRREQSIQDVPLSITAFSAKELEERGAISLSDMASFTPNMSFSSNPGGQNVRIRGVGAADTFTFYDPGVGVYVDDVYLPRLRGVDLDLVGIERVEVLRGPQGTLFGRNTIGGAINITTSRPRDELSGSVMLTAGSYDRLELMGSIEGPILPGLLSGKLAGVSRSRDGYQRRINFETGEKIGEQDDVDRYSLRGSLNWTPDEDITILLFADYSVADEAGKSIRMQQIDQTPVIQLLNVLSDPDYSDQFLTSDPYKNYSTGFNVTEVETWGVAMNVTWNFDSITFRSITSYRDQDTRDAFDFDGSPITLFEQDASETADSISQEFQLHGTSPDDRFNWVTGLYYGSEEGSSEWPTYLFQPLYDVLGMDVSSFLIMDVDNWNVAAFGQSTYKLTDRLSITIGARYSYDDKTVGRIRQRVNTPVVLAPYMEIDDTWSAWSGRLGFEFQLTDDMMTYLSVSRGYKSGGINGLAGNNPKELSPYDPEFLLTYEVGLRSDWLDQKLRFNASVFFSDYEDLQFRIGRLDPDGGVITVTDNVAGAEIKGVEIELVAVPTDGLQLSAGLGYMDAAYDEIDAGSPISLEDDLVSTPEWSITVTSQYTKLLKSGSELAVRLDYAYLTEQQLVYANHPEAVMPDYSMINARLTYLDVGGNWEAAIFATNLNDEEVITWAFDATTAHGIPAGYAPPRMWGASLKYNFF